MTTTESSKNRYFLDPSTICFYCRETGHRFRDCEQKLSFCNICEQDHDPSTCSLADVCFKCFKRGHGKKDCPIKKAKYCVQCQVYGHATMECEHAWRRYEFNDNTPTPTTFTVSCYYCGGTDHFGDFCGAYHVTYHKTAFKMDCKEVDDILQRVERKRKELGLSRMYKPDEKFVYAPGPNGSGGAMKWSKGKRKRSRDDRDQSSAKKSKVSDGRDRDRDYAVDRSSRDRHDQKVSRNSSDKFDRDGSKSSYDRRDEESSRYTNTKELPRRERQILNPESESPKPKKVYPSKKERKQKAPEVKRQIEMAEHDQRALRKSVDSATVIFDERTGLVPAKGFQEAVKKMNTGKEVSNSDIFSRLGSKASTKDINVDFADTSNPKTFTATTDNKPVQMNRKMKRAAARAAKKAAIPGQVQNPSYSQTSSKHVGKKVRGKKNSGQE